MRGTFDRTRSSGQPESRLSDARRGSQCSFQGGAVFVLNLAAGPSKVEIFSGPNYGFQIVLASNLSPENPDVRVKMGRVREAAADPEYVTARLGTAVAEGCCDPEEGAPFDRITARVPSGATGTMTFLVYTKPPTITGIVQAVLIDRNGSVVSTANPLPVVSAAPPAPGTFTPTHAAPVTVGAASVQVLAAGAYGHIYFRNASKAGQRITVCGGGITAVLEQGWTLGQTASGDGDIANWGHPMKMPIGAFNAVASAAAGILLVSSGV